MPIHLSKTEMTSFCGDILPLHIHFDKSYHINLKNADIEWRASNDCVSIRSFAGEGEMCFRNGVLLLLNKVGSAVVTARLGEKEYTCAVTVRALNHATPEDELNYYFADLHDHTTDEHNHERFAKRQCKLQTDYIDYIKNENTIDCCVISDHGGTLNETDFFRGFTEVEAAEPMHTVILPGCEAEAVIVENDRFDIPHRNAGEVLMFNVADFGARRSWAEFDKLYESSPMPVAIFAHPQIIGFSTPGIWDFHFNQNNSPERLALVRGIEMGDGSERQQNLIHEYAYASALDAGFKVSTTCASDSHGQPHRFKTIYGVKPDALWGYYRFPGKTIIMAPEKSKEAFIDALRSNRFYASENGNLKLRYTVNGNAAPCDLPLTDTYTFHVEASCFKDIQAHTPINCKVISDGGETLLTITDVDFSSFDFEISSKTARYFYLRFIDAEGNRTWSMPVWTGRAFDTYTAPQVTPIDMHSCTAVDLTTGKDASVVINGDPLQNWEADNDAPSILIDMHAEKEICALGNYPRTFNRKTYNVDLTEYAPHFTSGIPTEVAVSVSKDGNQFDKVAHVRCLVFGTEQIITFPKVKARYVRFDVLSTVGRENAPKKYVGRPVGIANLSLFD